MRFQSAPRDCSRGDLKKKIHRQDLKGKLALFKRTKPGIFPAVDFAAFSGLKPGTISSGLGKYAARGLLRSEGKTGRQILWRFA